jgi:hypothetical protein
VPLGAPRKIGEGCRFHSFTTNTYKLHFLESPSGIKVGGCVGGSVVGWGGGGDGPGRPRGSHRPLLAARRWGRPQPRPLIATLLGAPCLPPIPPPAQLVLNTSPDVGDLREVLAYVYEAVFNEYVAKNPLYTPGEPFA